MVINEEFEKMIEKRYIEMKKGDISEDFLNKPTLGGIKIFINNQPKHFFLVKEIGADLVYVGSESI